jgi:hypothetical protein
LIFKSSRKLHIKRLHYGGLITNYYCTSRCGHCLYNCSPQWEKKYIDDETTRSNLEKIRALGCHSIHIGGGEPLLHPQGLARVLALARKTAVAVEYVETNSSWYKNKESTVAVLEELKEHGLAALLVSISPFHNEHIPFYKVKGVIEACRIAGVSTFPWIREFIPEVDALDDRIPHKPAEYVERFGQSYLKTIPNRYWVHFGGRALTTYAHVLVTKDLQTLLNSNSGGCSELADVTHFHLDLFGNYIPGLCSGLAIHRDDLGAPISSPQYPILSLLFTGGISALFQLAVTRFDFKPAERYRSKCHLCTAIRNWMVLEQNFECKELQPTGFYENW